MHHGDEYWYRLDCHKHKDGDLDGLANVLPALATAALLPQP